MSLSDLEKKELALIIQKGEELLNCDFKAKYHAPNDDFITDFLSLANANIKGNSYIIYGLKQEKENENESTNKVSVNTDFKIKSAVRGELTKILKKINIMPDYGFFEYQYNNFTFDVLKISLRYDIPYIATEGALQNKDLKNKIHSREYRKIEKKETYGPGNIELDRGGMMQIWRRYFNLNHPPQEMFVRYVMDFENWHLKEIRDTLTPEEFNKSLREGKGLVELKNMELVYMLDTDYKIEVITFRMFEVNDYAHEFKKLRTLKEHMLGRQLNPLEEVVIARYKIFYKGLDLNKYFGGFNQLELSLLGVTKDTFTPFQIMNTNKICEYTFNDCRNFGEKLIHFLFNEEGDKFVFLHIVEHMICYHISRFPSPEKEKLQFYNKHILEVWSKVADVNIELPEEMF